MMSDNELRHMLRRSKLRYRIITALIATSGVVATVSLVLLIAWYAA